MKVEVLLFAQLREVLGAGSLTVDVEAGTTVSRLAADLLASRGAVQVAALPLRYAVGEAFVEADHRLCEGDIVALMPPVCGG